ncbi:MAG: hypothetical protein M1272_01180, partial [Firmicutes bacterium]|nr:hypothetical protein [Bacillota bacterium]
GEASPQWRMDVVDGGAPRREAAVHEGLPHPLPERVLWVVDADRAVKEWSQKLGTAGYLTSLPIGELMRLEEQARRGMVQQLVVSQWRPWPRLWDWCDAVIWLCRPRNQVKWEESAALAREGGTVWLKSSHDTRVEVKAERLRLTRERLGRHWRLWQRQQRVGLLPGRAVFDELDLHPGRMRAGERRPLEQSHLYRRAVIESMNDVECPFTAPIAGEEEMHGVD